MLRINYIPEPIKNRVLMLYMARMKFFYTMKTLKWFLTYRYDQDADEEKVRELTELIEKRA